LPASLSSLIDVLIDELIDVLINDDEIPSSPRDSTPT
jgi:hypothetical protein